MKKDNSLKNAYKAKARKDKTRVRLAFMDRFPITQRGFEYKMQGVHSKFTDEEKGFLLEALKEVTE